MVKLDEALSSIKERALTEAQLRNMDEFDERIFLKESRLIIEDAFCALTLERVENGIIKSRDSINTWKHRFSDQEIENDWKRLVIDRSALQRAAEQYLDRPWMSGKELDWFFVDSLVYSEFQATLDAVRVQMWSMPQYIAKKTGENPAWLIAWRVLAFIFPWASWLGALAFAGAIAGPIGALAVVFVASAIMFWRWNQRRKIIAILGAMAKSYSQLNTVSQGWRALWSELNESRGKGAVWDGIVFRIVEVRMNDAKGSAQPSA